MHPDQWPGRPQLKPWVGTHPDKQPSCLGAQNQSAPVGTYPSQWPGPPQLKPHVGLQLDQQPCCHGQKGPKPGISGHPDHQFGCVGAQTQSAWVSEQATGSVAGCPLAQTQSGGSAATPVQSRDQPHNPTNGLAAYRRPHPKALVLKNSYCTQNPAGPTGSPGGRQNTQQRGAAGLGENAFPRKTPPSRGLNYPIAVPRAPSI